jgi:preprotein translocase subunit SecE
MSVGQPSQSKKQVSNSSENAPAPLQRGRGFFHEVMVELKKTTWPTLPEAWRLTVVVLAVIVSVAIFVGAIDFVLSQLTARLHIIK